MAHTPGPWKLEGTWSLDSKQPLGGWVSTMHPSPLFSLEPITGTPANIIANARLIAAAPELLAAAKELLDHDGADGSKDYHAMKLYDARERLRAAIAAAEPQP